MNRAQDTAPLVREILKGHRRAAEHQPRRAESASASLSFPTSSGQKLRPT